MYLGIQVFLMSFHLFAKKHSSCVNNKSFFFVGRQGKCSLVEFESKVLEIKMWKFNMGNGGPILASNYDILLIIRLLEFSYASWCFSILLFRIYIRNVYAPKIQNDGIIWFWPWLHVNEKPSITLTHMRQRFAIAFWTLPQRAANFHF
jgi:hypothetical protein